MSEGKSPQWAMATPAVLYIVGVACFGVFALLSGLVTPGAIPYLAVFLIAGGIAALICGTIELARGDILLGSIDMVFGALIFLGLGFIFATFAWVLANVAEALPPDLRIIGYFAAGLALLFFLFLPNVGKVSWSLFLAFIVLGVGLACMAWGQLTLAAFGALPMMIAAYCFLIFGLYVIYAGTVFITNTVYAAPKLPIGGPIFK